MLNTVQRQVIRLINSLNLQCIYSTIELLAVCCKIVSLSLFYRYYHGSCSRELAVCVPPPHLVSAHWYCVSNVNLRIERCAVSFLSFHSFSVVLHATSCLS